MELFKKIKSKPNNIDILVAENLKNRRKQLGITQKELAIAVNVTIQQIQKYETARNRISCGTLYYLAKALEAPLSYFFGSESEQEVELWVNNKKVSITQGGNIDIQIKGMQLSKFKG